MNVRVRLFSILRERAGTRELSLELPKGADVSGALQALGRRLPAIESWLAGRERLSLLTAVNREYARPEHALHEGDEVAVFPPVSGGAAPTSDAPAKGLLLLSGGFDSPVAGHMILASGRALEAVHFTMEPFTDDASVHKARALAARLGLAGVTVVPLGEDLASFVRNCDHRVYFVLLKRLMLRVAQALSGRLGTSFLVTGENLGQVSSQTLSNLSVIDAAATQPILRPLLGLDKRDIIRLAERIGTFETSKGPELCDTLGPAHPSTFTTTERIEGEEAKVDLEALVQNALAKAYLAPAQTTLLARSANAAC